MKTRKLGLPSGSLLQPTIELLKKIGVMVHINGRGFIAEIEGSNIFTEAFITRPDRLPRAVASGKIDSAITGWDFVLEKGFQSEVIKVVELNYSKTSRHPVRVVVFSKKEKIIDQKNISVLSEYPKLTKGIFKKSTIDLSTGTTEADVAFGIYDYGVGVVETGRSLLDNGLKILKTIIVSPTVLIASYLSEEVKTFGEMLKGVLRAEHYCLLKFNASIGDKNRILALVPSMESSTVNNLVDGDIAIETVVRKDSLSDLIIAVKKEGGRKIIVQSIDVSV